MIAALIIPELIATWAMRQWFGTRRVTRQFNESGHPIARLDSQDYTWTQTHSFSVLMGGYMLYVDGKPYHTLQPHDVLELIRTGCIDAPTLPAADQIYDRSEGNAISKGLIILQAAWFVMQFITRTIYHLETTQLETGTLAFAVLNLATSTVWWNKPLNVQFPHPVHWKSTGSRPEDHINDVAEETFSINVSARGPIFQQIAQLIGADDIPTFRKLRVPTFGSIIELEKLNKTVLLHAGFLVVTIFGGIHCMAWLFAFPTHQGQPEVLWRLSAIAITCAPWFHPLATILAFLVTLVLGDEGATLFFLIWFGSVILYITSRVILLVLMFTTLRSRPPGAYKTVS
ncbi:hypothetical protein BDR03DRAFT_1089877 [Suillus americanus]|nr:hypothetical protein BDR03DRAFT_1089877 [Suillus americanus]